MKPRIEWATPAKESSQIAEIGHCAATNTMGVRFKNGGEYHYHNVTPTHYKLFATADSLGKHLGAHIKGKFQFTKQESK
jgi:hypothetical protein